MKESRPDGQSACVRVTADGGPAEHDLHQQPGRRSAAGSAARGRQRRCGTLKGGQRNASKPKGTSHKLGSSFIRCLNRTHAYDWQQPQLLEALLALASSEPGWKDRIVGMWLLLCEWRRFKCGWSEPPCSISARPDRCPPASDLEDGFATRAVRQGSCWSSCTQDKLQSCLHERLKLSAY